MPVVHSFSSVFRTDGVLTGHGPSSKVSTTSLSRRKSSSLKCSKPKPGPPVVSISTVRPTPSAFGLLHGALAGWAATGAAAAGSGIAAAAAWGAAAVFGGAVCAQVVLDTHSETAMIKPVATRILDVLLTLFPA